MAVTQRKPATTGIQTNAEGFQIPGKKSRGATFDRFSFILIGILQLVAVGIIAKQLKTLGLLPEDIDPDFRRLLRLIPRNPLFMVPCGHLHTRNIFIESENIVFPDGVAPGALHLKRGVIKHVYRQSEFTSAEITAFARTVNNLGGEVLDVGSLVVSPGVIDVHVHMNEPGRMDWEGIRTGTSAAITGGVTTVVDMPLNSKPTTTSASLMKNKIRKVWNKGRAQVAMWGGLTQDNAYDHSGLSEMLRLGAVGLKAFMCPSGINDFLPVSQRDIEAALPVLVRHRKPLMLHAELVSSAVQGTCDGSCDVRDHSTWSNSRPGQFEVDAARSIIAAMRTVRDSNPARWKNATTWTGTPQIGQVPLGFKVHIAHLGYADALPIYQKAVEEEGLPITVETCAHYLAFSEEDVPSGATQFKCAPPLRDSGNREQLRQAAGGAIAIVSSDHSPAPTSMKSLDSGSFIDAWGGIAGLQYTLPAVNTLARERKWSLKYLAEMLSEAPAALIGVSDRKGSIREGMDADLVIWDPWASTNTTAAACQHRWKASPYIDREMSGAVAMTIIEGAVVYQTKLGVATDQKCGSALLV